MVGRWSEGFGSWGRNSVGPVRNKTVVMGCYSGVSGTDNLSFAPDRLPAGRRLTKPPHISKTQRRAAEVFDN